VLGRAACASGRAAVSSCTAMRRSCAAILGIARTLGTSMRRRSAFEVTAAGCGAVAGGANCQAGRMATTSSLSRPAFFKEPKAVSNAQ
jgi:hypothetical protein